MYNATRNRWQVLVTLTVVRWFNYLTKVIAVTTTFIGLNHSTKEPVTTILFAYLHAWIQPHVEGCCIVCAAIVSCFQHQLLLHPCVLGGSVSQIWWVYIKEKALDFIQFNSQKEKSHIDTWYLCDGHEIKNWCFAKFLILKKGDTDGPASHQLSKLSFTSMQINFHNDPNTSFVTSHVILHL